MSAGSDLLLPADARVHAELSLLAPAFRRAVEAAIAECHTLGLGAMVYETYRTDALQRIYYARGRTTPGAIVTRAPNNRSSWHGYGLAVDVIHQLKRWDMPDRWFAQVADVFKRHGCDWGGDWLDLDLPHFQWGTLKKSPSDLARELLETRGLMAVWAEVGAL